MLYRLNFNARNVTVNDVGQALEYLMEDTRSIKSSKLCCDLIFINVMITPNRLIQGFTCAGIIPSQYIHFSSFSGIGTVGKWYIRSGMYAFK